MAVPPGTSGAGSRSARAELISRAMRRRDELALNPDDNAYRLFNMSGDGIAGLTIDRYDTHILVQTFDEALNADQALVGDILQALSFTGISSSAVLLKYRGKVDVDDIAATRVSIALEGELPKEPFPVRHNGISALVDLVSGQSTGLFLDMREIRYRLASYYCGSLLNLFCYTGIFSVHGLKNGAERAVNIDLSRTVLARAMDNYRINGLLVDDRDFIYGDAGEWVRRFARAGRLFDFIIVDPPTFARKGKCSFAVNRDYLPLLRQVDRIARRYVLTAVNTYGVSRDEYLSWHPQGWELRSFDHESSDFVPGENYYLKVGLWEKKAAGKNS